VATNVFAFGLFFGFLDFHLTVDGKMGFWILNKFFRILVVLQDKLDIGFSDVGFYLLVKKI
jgi:hypothetical protein